MSDGKADQVSAACRNEGTVACGPGCGCERGGLGRAGKVVICLLICAVAGLVFAHSVARKSKGATSGMKTGFFTTVATTDTPPLATPAREAAKPANPAKPVVWGKTLTGLADLNKVAPDQDAVLVYLPQKGQAPTASVKQQILEAARKAQAGGTRMACYTLDANSKDYAQITSQRPAPCVLAMAKGHGTNVVSGQITEQKLLKAVVTASNSSGCCSSGCGTSGCK